MEVNIRNVSINYKIVGEGKPVIMLHGFTLDHRVMTGCMEPIFKEKDDYKRIYIDLPGMGKSESAEWITNSDIMLEIVIEFIEKIIPNENFLVVGESYGGYLSRGLVYKMRNRVDGVLLICPVITADFGKRNLPDNIVLVKDDNLLSKLTIEEAEELNYISVVQSEEIYKRYKAEIISGAELADMKFLCKLKEYGYEFSFDVDKLEEKFDKPSLILLGRQDSDVGYKDAWDILDNYSRATFSVLDMAGHNLHLEQVEIFNCLVGEWLKRVKNF